MIRRNMMFRSLCALLALLSGVAAHAAAPKPRVFCADGSPEGFDPSLWDSVSTSNVTRQIFQGLLGFARGGIKFCNAEFDRLIEQARTVTDAERRNALYREAQLIFKRERPWITMAHSSVYIPIRRDVKGFVMSPNGSVDFEGVWRE